MTSKRTKLHTPDARKENVKEQEEEKKHKNK